MSSDFNKLYRERVDSIYRFVFFKVSDKDLAWDITQECFLKMWRQIQDGAEVKNSNALLYAIARNLVIDYWRQKDHRQNVGWMTWRIFSVTTVIYLKIQHLRMK